MNDICTKTLLNSSEYELKCLLKIVNKAMPAILVVTLIKQIQKTMKSFKFIAILLLGLSFFSCSEGNIFSNEDESSIEVPKVVLDAFATKYANAKSIEWEKENTIYIAEFKLDNVEFEAEFDMDGFWMQTEKEVDVKDLPAAVIAKINTDYPDFKIEEAEEVETSEITYFELEIENGEMEYEIGIDNSGKILFVEEEDEDDNQDGDDNDEDNDEEHED